ncbi:MAG: alpha/beta fold hydrolase [Ancrocorticia sp.]
MRISGPSPDYLGPTWQARTIFLEEDDGGAPKGRPDVAVLIHESDARELVSHSGVAALYLPGFTDTFFHVEQANAWREAGVPLVGLEFRRTARALRSTASRDDIRDIYVREEEIGAALTYIRNTLGASKIILIGHSTGGLQAALWAGDHPGSVDAVILNSPWLDHNGPEFEKDLVTRVVDRVGLRFPRLRISMLTPEYAENLHEDFGGEWSFNPAHKPITKVPVHAGFFRTVRRAHQRIARGGVHIHEPLLVAHSKESGNFKKPTAEELRTTDVVLNVEDMKRLARVLNPDATLLAIPGGRHDLALSERQARDLYTRETIAWAVTQLGL